MGNSASLSANKTYLNPTYMQVEWLREVQTKLGGISRNDALRRLFDWAKLKGWPDQQ